MVGYPTEGKSVSQAMSLSKAQLSRLKQIYRGSLVECAKGTHASNDLALLARGLVVRSARSRLFVTDKGEQVVKSDAKSEDSKAVQDKDVQGKARRQGQPLDLGRNRRAI